MTPGDARRAFQLSLLRLQAEQGVPNRELSARSGVGISAISLIGNGRREPMLTTAWALAEALETTVDAMISGPQPGDVAKEGRAS